VEGITPSPGFSTPRRSGFAARSALTGDSEAARRGSGGSVTCDQGTQIVLVFSQLAIAAGSTLRLSGAKPIVIAVRRRGRKCFEPRQRNGWRGRRGELGRARELRRRPRRRRPRWRGRCERRRSSARTERTLHWWPGLVPRPRHRARRGWRHWRRLGGSHRRARRLRICARRLVQSERRSHCPHSMTCELWAMSSARASSAARTRHD
jgi:hypothetical protein